MLKTNDLCSEKSREFKKVTNSERSAAQSKACPERSRRGLAVAIQLPSRKPIADSGNLPRLQLSGLCPRCWKNLYINPGRRFAAGQRQIIRHLHLHPEIGRGPEIPGQAQRRIRRNSPAFPHNLGDPRYWYTQGKGQSIGRKSRSEEHTSELQ